jgi:membrane associated rhomboid family serine protease
MSEPSMSSAPPPPYSATPPEAAPTCYRHPGQKAGVTCQRCNRPICWRCMHQASVGFQCPECVHEAAARSPVITPRSMPTERPWVTYALIAVNLAVFAAEVATMTGQGNLVSGIDGSVYQHGVLYGPLVHAGEWWRLFTGGFLHAGLLHVGMNMFVLYRIGPMIESLLGRARYLALYVAALLAGTFGVLLVSPLTPTLGASGAIFGLLGAAAAYQLSRGINIMRSGLGNLIIINIVITFVGASFISVGGHIGGLVGGAACGYLMFLLEDRQQPKWVGVLIGVAVSAVLVAASIAVSPVGRVVVG